MKFLGIDYGTKRLGFATSDASGRIAFPVAVAKNNLMLLPKIDAIIKSENIGEIVVGESLDFQNMPNLLQREIDFFIKKITKRYKLPIHKEKEFFSSAEAHGRQGKESMHSRQTQIKKTEELDAKAAAIILQRYLDKINK